MCDTCGCNVSPANQHLLEEGGKLAKDSQGNTSVEVLHSLLHENDHQAAHNRAHFDAQQALVINLMSSPGSGKTALLEKTAEQLQGRFNIAVIEGDLETENDAQRLRNKGVRAHQISTGSACHLDAHMVHDALHEFSLEGVDILFIENVGNLVCPASFDLGHHLNITLLSTTEGDDKPAKYPVIFRAADLMIISKTDLLAVLDDFSSERATKHFRQLAKAEPVLSLSAKNGEGMNAWLDWLMQALTQHRDKLKQAPVSHHHHTHSHA